MLHSVLVALAQGEGCMLMAVCYAGLAAALMHDHALKTDGTSSQPCQL